ncbi:hypothetical protein [Aliarcobacter butzleri]|uniref:hypothetical protein n=1 Tax=Aliarcobacter butzleri TaxID=28197 RepID=UPI0021B4ACDA|nr:hypothetical protein [Aliarcobacter butzleri]MCT7649134.1 hypothetical protein [Aliarcobacter butzleri]
MLKNLFKKKSDKKIDEITIPDYKELIKETEILDNHIEEKQEVKIIDKPKICCIDIEESDINKLKEQGFNIEIGSLGSKVKVPNRMQKDWNIVLPNAYFPTNLHEFDITILDLDNNKTIDYIEKEHQKNEHTGTSSMALCSAYPETIFNPKPFGSYLLNESLQKLRNKEHLVIIFTTENYEINYKILEITNHSNSIIDESKYNIYSFQDYVPLNGSKDGKEVIVCDNIDIKLKDFLSKYINQMQYNQTFYTSSYKQCLPLIKNTNEDIVSIQINDDNKTYIYLPQVEEKAKFLNEFLSEIAPSLFPNLFPYATLHDWRNEKDYYLPNHEVLLQQKQDLISEYEQKIQNKTNEIDNNLKKYDFLHKILTETGDELVISIIEFLKWLGFENIVDMDETKKEDVVLEEDIQIQLENGLLIIECKGIGGTSKDSECSQISKIKFRRCEERNTFDVFALYIVNHQRHIAPLQRKNPPFTENQIKDAVHDKRGLLTTWQLYNLYFDIENGVITKEEARESLLDFGLVEFKPTHLIKIATSEKLYQNGTICSININNLELKVGDKLFIEKNNKFTTVTILEIQENKKQIESISNGQIGLKLSKAIKNESILWKKELIK